MDSSIIRIFLFQEMYKNLEVDYLMDPEDSIAHYMKVGKQRVEEMESERDSAISAALAEMPHSVAINVAQGKRLYIF